MLGLEQRTCSGMILSVCMPRKIAVLAFNLQVEMRDVA